jgi:hypothetical protein
MLFIPARYQHENIIQIVGYSIDGPHVCLVHQFMVNGSLEDRLACKVYNSGYVLKSLKTRFSFPCREEASHCVGATGITSLLEQLVACSFCTTPQMQESLLFMVMSIVVYCVPCFQRHSSF